MIGVFSRSRNLIYFRTISSLKKSSIVRKLRLKPLQIQTNTNQLRTKLKPVENKIKSRESRYCAERAIPTSFKSNQC